jgi:hypothetical protein
MQRRRLQVWFVVLGVPLLVAIGWLLRQSDPPGGRGLLILDVPADITVTVEGRALRPCKDEYRPHGGCTATPTPGFSRRYAWSVLRARPVEVTASRGTATTSTTVTAPAEGPTPHLVLGESFSWRVVGGTRMDGDDAVFVDDAGRVIGPAGPSEPD